MGARSAFNLQSCARPNILKLKPYRCARDDYKDDGRNVLLDANENAYGPGLALDGNGSLPALDSDPQVDFLGLNRYPDPHQIELKQKFFGSDEAIDALLRCFCVPGRDKILTCPPTYGMYAVSADTNDIAIVPVPLDVDNGFALQPQLICERLSADADIKLVYICSPGNPTASLIGKGDVQQVLEHPTWNGIVVVDEAYIDFSPEGSSLAEWTLEWPNLVVMQTLSKAFGLAGIRLGVAFADAAVAQLLNNIKAPYNISSPTSAIANAALEESNLGVMRQNRAKIIEQRDRLLKEMPAIPGVGRSIGGTDANFLLVEILDAFPVVYRVPSIKMGTFNATRNYYADLGVSPTADEDEIKKHFRQLAREYHPDRNPGHEVEVVSKFQDLQEAYEVLSDSTKRSKYDAARAKSQRAAAAAANQPAAHSRDDGYASRRPARAQTTSFDTRPPHSSQSQSQPRTAPMPTAQQAYPSPRQAPPPSAGAEKLGAFARGAQRWDRAAFEEAARNEGKRGFQRMPGGVPPPPMPPRSRPHPTAPRPPSTPTPTPPDPPHGANPGFPGLSRTTSARRAYYPDEKAAPRSAYSAVPKSRQPQKPDGLDSFFPPSGYTHRAEEAADNGMYKYPPPPTREPPPRQASANPPRNETRTQESKRAASAERPSTEAIFMPAKFQHEDWAEKLRQERNLSPPKQQRAGSRPKEVRRTAGPTASSVDAMDVDPAPKDYAHPRTNGEINLDDLKSAAPLSAQGGGLDGLSNDLKSNLPFESRAAPFPNLEKNFSAQARLKVADLPRPPKLVHPPLGAYSGSQAWQEYTANINTYLRDWAAYEERMIDHFHARNRLVRTALADDWATNLFDGPPGHEISDNNAALGGQPGSTKKAGYGTYMDWLEDDKVCHIAWETARDRHRQCLQELGQVRERLKAAARSEDPA
ncbi:hypothetical protein DV735_g1941, partial [Chaetothyriales sp. CBS 134920]